MIHPYQGHELRIGECRVYRNHQIFIRHSYTASPPPPPLFENAMIIISNCPDNRRTAGSVVLVYCYIPLNTCIMYNVINPVLNHNNIKCGLIGETGFEFNNLPTVIKTVVRGGGEGEGRRNRMISIENNLHATHDARIRLALK